MKITGKHEDGTLVIELDPGDSALLIDGNNLFRLFAAESLKSKLAMIKSFLPSMGFNPWGKRS
ncbi:MAG: hypothetical protein ACXABY_20630 [Candidatus Thorarchaeota archaeon]